MHYYPSSGRMHFFQDSCKILSRTYKIMQYSWRILQDLTKMKLLGRRGKRGILEDKAIPAISLQYSCKKYVICNSLARMGSSAKILQEKNISTAIFEIHSFERICHNLERLAFLLVWVNILRKENHRLGILLPVLVHYEKKSINAVSCFPL